MKDLSYLQAFSHKVLRESRRIIAKGFTLKDINDFLEEPDKYQMSPEVEAELRQSMKAAETLERMGFGQRKPCGGCGKKNKKEA